MKEDALEFPKAFFIPLSEDQLGPHLRNHCADRRERKLSGWTEIGTTPIVQTGENVSCLAEPEIRTKRTSSVGDTQFQADQESGKSQKQ